MLNTAAQQLSNNAINKAYAPILSAIFKEIEIQANLGEYLCDLSSYISSKFYTNNLNDFTDLGNKLKNYLTVQGYTVDIQSRPGMVSVYWN